jgi:general secretion pathway protein D
MNRIIPLMLILVFECCCMSSAVVCADDGFQTWSLKHVEPTYVRRILSDLLGDKATSLRILADDEIDELIVQGPESSRKMAAKLIHEIDRPVQAAVEDPKTELRDYPVPSSRIDEKLNLIRELMAGTARISADTRTSRIMVVTTAANHKLIHRLLHSGAVETSAANDGTRPVTVQSADALFPDSGFRPVSGQGDVKISHRFQEITADQCVKAMQRLLKDKLETRADGILQYTVPEVGTARLQFDHTHQTCVVSGDREVADQFLNLIEWFERSQSRSSSGAVRFVPLRNVNPDVLKRAIRIWRDSSAQADAKRMRSSKRASRLIEQVAFTQEGDVLEGAPADAPNPVEAEGPDNDDLRPPLSGVAVQPFPGLDVLAVQGKDADVNELIRIIREIERLSEEATPEVEVYHLKHVDSSTLNTFATTVLNALTEPLQGRVAITPMEKPNALLLIGWGEAVAAAKGLIEELDQPVSPDHDMRIFTLQNAGTTEILAPLQSALQRTGGMGPQATVTANPRTNSLIVYAAPRDMAEIERLIEHLDAETSGTVNKGRMVRLKNSLAGNVAQTITSAIAAAAGGGGGRQASELEMLLVRQDGREVVASGILNDVTITPDIRTNTLFITGPEGSIPLVERLIEHLDQSPAASAVIKVFEIANGNASDLVSVLRTLFPVTAVGSGVPALATAEGESSLVPVRFSVDVRTNTIIATGTSGDLQVMEALLLRLDEVASQERVTEVYQPRNSPAIAIADAVNEYLRSERVVNQAAPGRANPFEQIQQEVVVVPEPTRNQLIISATPRFFDQIMELVEDLDTKPPQVLIQVILAEVDLDNFHEVGVELGIQDSLLFDRSLLGDLEQTIVTNSLSTPAGVVTTTQENIVAASNTPGFNFNNLPLGNSGSNRSLATAPNVAGQGLSHFTLGRTNADLNYGGLVLSASSENVSVLLRALDRTGSMEILSRPQIMTLDNTEAFIQVGQVVPRIASSQVTVTGQVNTIEEEDVGLLLGVIPRINPDGTVVMQVDATKSDVGPEAEGIPVFVSTEGTVVRSPRVNITNTRTTVSAASGQTVVIGGLITSSNMTEHRKVPWLGDLPVLGKLFRYDQYRNRRTELLVILTPHVILGAGDVEYRKQVEMSRMSWVSSDVFEFLDSGPECYPPPNDAGVEVIYPDATPSLEYSVPAVPAVPGDNREPRIMPIPIDSEQIPEADDAPATGLNDQPKSNQSDFKQASHSDADSQQENGRPRKNRSTGNRLRSLFSQNDEDGE